MQQCNDTGLVESKASVMTHMLLSSARNTRARAVGAKLIPLIQTTLRCCEKHSQQHMAKTVILASKSELEETLAVPCFYVRTPLRKLLPIFALDVERLCVLLFSIIAFLSRSCSMQQ
jgi:hypothetical protein